MKITEIRRDIDRLGPWFHDLELDGERTAPDHPLGSFHHELWGAIQGAFPADLSGKTVLDIGCNAGFYSFKLAERGARVTGVDHDARYLAQARFAAEVLGFDLEFRQMEVYDLDRLGETYDYVLFMGVFYHLRHPLYGLEKAVARVREHFLFQTLVRGCADHLDVAPDHPMGERAVFERPGFPAMYFVEHRYAGDPTNWWIPNDAAAAAVLRSCGLLVEHRLSSGLYVCRPEPGTGSRPDRSHVMAERGGMA